MTGWAQILVSAGHHQARISGFFFLPIPVGTLPPTAGRRLTACVWIVEGDQAEGLGG